MDVIFERRVHFHPESLQLFGPIDHRIHRVIGIGVIATISVAVNLDAELSPHTDGQTALIATTLAALATGTVVTDGTVVFIGSLSRASVHILEAYDAPEEALTALAGDGAVVFARRHVVADDTQLVRIGGHNGQPARTARHRGCHGVVVSIYIMAEDMGVSYHTIQWPTLIANWYTKAHNDSTGTTDYTPVLTMRAIYEYRKRCLK
jgi:hypothetical protein